MNARIEPFISIEHDLIGEKATSKLTLRLPNGLKLSFGQIIALAGDFYGVPEKPIIDPTEKDTHLPHLRRKRFMEWYATLANADGIELELDQILEVMDEEKRLMKKALDNNATFEDIEKFETSLVQKWDEITGGTWIKGVPIVFGRVMKLINSNYDHFMPYAKDAYLVGHELAMEKAKEASKAANDEEKSKLIFEEALSIEAFACHFLTDSFASGHMRTPRRELPEQVALSKIGDLLCKYMHDEDNKFGLRVTNKRGDKWVAYGDCMLLKPEDKPNFEIVVQAVKTSVKEVMNAFDFPGFGGRGPPTFCPWTPLETHAFGARQPPHIKYCFAVPVRSTSVTDYIPFVDTSAKNNFPMFQLKKGKLHRRADLENLSDSATIDDWTGVGTAWKLKSYKPSRSQIP